MQNNKILNVFGSIYNGQKDKKLEISIPYSKKTHLVTSILYNEGYIRGYLLNIKQKAKYISILLKYNNNTTIIKHAQQISTTTHKVFIANNTLNKLTNNQGIHILSTTKGFISNKIKTKLNQKYKLGGELICKII
jgi:ribosomal protein S8